ncbi:MAG: hypothetical protein A2Z65_00890 [Gallionellales bacterium RIFCSPLOWO2_02_58_13]|nr:MAG: hypothetical protein A2Z65_00890 [Gallionellales bacterium RIFCSPLOWO2_02_58_13]
MTDAMFHYTKTENCPIPTPTLPLKGREPGSSPFKGEVRIKDTRTLVLAEPGSSPFKGEVRRGMGANGAMRTENHE